MRAGSLAFALFSPRSSPARTRPRSRRRRNRNRRGCLHSVDWLDNSFSKPGKPNLGTAAASSVSIGRRKPGDETSLTIGPTRRRTLREPVHLELQRPGQLLVSV